MLNKSIINKYFNAFIFNFNTVLLPIGIMWSNIFSIFLIISILKKNAIQLFSISSVFMIYILIQYYTNDIHNIKSFLLGSAYFYSSIIVGMYFYIFFNQKYEEGYIENIFLIIIKTNLFLTFFALLFYMVPIVKNTLWHVSNNINSLGEVRLQLLYYEPSHFSFVFLFFGLYLLLNVIFYPAKRYSILLILTFISIFLAKSLGTISTMGISIGIGFIVFFIPLIRKFYKKILGLLLIIIIIIPIFGGSILNRIDKFSQGKDNSGNVRLIYSTLSAYNMIDKYNINFGVGFGQTKEYIVQFTSKIRGYGANRLPNTFASTLATVGIIGITLKYLFLLYFFIKKKIYNNIFKLIIFIYLLLYSFVGGWMLNVYEFIFLALIFSNAFSQFNNDFIFKKI